MARIFRKSSDIVARSVAGEYLLIPIRGNIADMSAIFSLNTVGAFIWKNLDAEKTAGEISACVSSAFDVDHQTADADVTEFLGELLNAKLIADRA